MGNSPLYMTKVYTLPSEGEASGLEIYVGSRESATYEADLDAYNIQGILNVAYDLDDQPSPARLRATRPVHAWQESHASQDGKDHYQQQYAKVGLIDGPGNSPTTMLAAVYMADQLLNTPNPKYQTTFPRGNLLIHCFAGRSRSVTIAALYIYYRFGLYMKQADVSDFSTTYRMVQKLRGDYGPPPPTQGMQEIASVVVETYAALFPVPERIIWDSVRTG